MLHDYNLHIYLGQYNEVRVIVMHICVASWVIIQDIFSTQFVDRKRKLLMMLCNDSEVMWS